jgi:hypothetical protein
MSKPRLASNTMTEKDYATEILAELFSKAKAQFGNAAKTYWFYDGDTCPSCGRQVGVIKHKGRDALALNAFLYRERGVLIGYLLCEKCAREIFKAARKNPMQQTPLHEQIEQNLIEAYQRYLNSLDA